MKKALQRYFDFLLSNFKIYRRKKGGVWYKVRELDVSGIAAGSDYWTQKAEDPKWTTQLAKEDYTKQER